MSHANEPKWVYKVLSANHLTAAGKSVVPERKSAAILSYLALEGDVPRSKIAGLLWPGSEETTARNNLSQTLRRFRQLAGEALIVAEDPLRLSKTLVVDAAQLKAAALSGNAAEVARYQGELLASFDYDDLPEFSEWLWSTREALSAFGEEALDTLVSTSERHGNLEAALKYAERSLAANPVSEAVHRSVMRLHYLLGNRPAALKAYHRCQATLERELAVAPLPETVELARLIARGEVPARGDATSRRARTLPPQVLRPPVLVGREAAWAALDAAWARGQTIYVTGEAGIGKTRLVQEFAASKGRALYLPAQPGYQDVLFAGAAGLARTRIAEAPGVQLPDWVARELSRILPEFSTRDALPALHNEEDKLRFYQAYLEMVRLTSAGFAAVISDDTQYYDPATVELGGFMISQRALQPTDSAAPRHFIVYRRGELSRATQRYVDQFVTSELASRLELAPLDAKSTTSLLVSLNLSALEDGVAPQLADAVYRRTEGNTLFILETLRNLIETDQLGQTLPEHLPLGSRVSATIQQRLVRLSPAAQRVMQAAAVLQSDFDVELVAQVLGSDPLALLEVWEELERAHIVSGNRFSHALFYEAVTSSMSQQVSALLNRRSAEVLAARGATPARTAKHYLASGDEARAAPYLLRAAWRAKDALRLVEAAERFERAGSIFKRLGEEAQAFDAYRAALKVRLEFDLGSNFEQALGDLKGMATTPLARAMMRRLEADWHMRRSTYRQAEASARRGLQELEEGDDTRARLELLTLLAGALARQGRSEESLVPLKQMLILADRASEQPWLAPQLSHAAAILDDLGRNREAFGYHRRALELERNPRRCLPQLADYGFSLLAFGDAQRALEILLEAKSQLGEAADAPVTESTILTYLGAAQHHLRHYAEALSSFAAALRLSERHHHLVHSEGTRVRRARLYLTLGRFDEAAADLEAAQRGEKPRHMYQVHLEATLGRLYALQGREGDAAEVFARVEQRLAEARSPRVLALVRLEQAAAAPREQRLALAQEVFELSSDLELPGLEIAARTLYAQRLLTLGSSDEAAQHARQAVTLMDAFTSVYCYPGEVLLTGYQTLQAVHDPQASVQLERCFSYVIETADQCVPAPYRDSFLAQNPVNRRILREAKRFGLQADKPPANRQAG